MNRRLLSLLLAAFTALPLAAQARCAEPRHTPPLSVLIVTGGHDYDAEEFFHAFDRIKGIRYEHTFTRDTARPQSFPLGGLKTYDVVVFYDMEHGPLTPEWRDLMDRGKGIVFLHHALGSFPLSTAFRAIAGGQANFRPERPAGVPLSTFEHNAPEHFTITDRAHPVTCGVRDFSMIDEGYDHYATEPGAHVVMTSDFPTDANKAAAWTWDYQGKRVFLLQPGHGSLGMPQDRGPSAFGNRDFMRLLTRAMFWSAGRLKPPLPILSFPRKWESSVTALFLAVQSARMTRQLAIPRRRGHFPRRPHVALRADGHDAVRCRRANSIS